MKKIIAIQLEYKLVEISQKVEQKDKKRREKGEQRRYILRVHKEPGETGKVFSGFSKVNIFFL